MKENNKNQTPNFTLPPLWCSAVCRNAMSEICIESCAITKDMSGFDPRPNISLLDMPRFPIKDAGKMTKEERFTIVAIYLSKIVDYLQGVENEYKDLNSGRHNLDSRRSRTLFKDFKVEDILSGVHESHPSPETGTQCEDQAVRPTEVADSTD